MRSQALTAWIARSIRVIVILLAIIGIATVTRRVLTLSGVIKPFISPKYGEFDKGFRLNPLLTFIHIIPGGLFMILAPLQFIPKIRSRYPLFHRLSGRIIFVLGLIIGITALVMSFVMTIGGLVETTATITFAIFFLFSLIKGYYHIRRHEVALHREWMIRMFAIGFAVATVRPIVGMFFALSHLSPNQFFGIAFWTGFMLHLIAAETWINFTNKRFYHDPFLQPPNP